MITWSQLNIHSKPILVLNTRGFFTPLVEWVNVAVRGGLEQSFMTHI